MYYPEPSALFLPGPESCTRSGPISITKRIADCDMCAMTVDCRSSIRQTVGLDDWV